MRGKEKKVGEEQGKERKSRRMISKTKVKVKKKRKDREEKGMRDSGFYC